LDGPQQLGSAAEIVSVVGHRIFVRLSDIGQRREMNHRHRTVSRDQVTKSRTIRELSGLERSSLKRFSIAALQVVKGHGRKPCGMQSLAVAQTSSQRSSPSREPTRGLRSQLTQMVDPLDQDFIACLSSRSD
jgi:hypothetical protein